METDWKPKYINLNQLEGAFGFEEGFSRPDWRVISKGIKEREALDEGAAWHEAVHQWMIHLRSDLGGDYQISESPHFFLLAPLDAETRTKILNFSENTLIQIRERLQSAAWNPKHGKHVILLFAEEDDYYQYISYFYHEGAWSRSGGCLIHREYVHIAAPYDPLSLRQTLAHELTHNCLAHLRLPRWLDEGLAQRFQRMVATRLSPLVDHERREKHLAFWNEQNIQEFWTGISWRKAGDSNQLSYNLAEIILQLLSERQGDWGAFVKQADWRDAGQTAALQCLDADLGDVMGTFLGPGKWRPRRRAMVALWEVEKKRREEKGESEGE